MYILYSMCMFLISERLLGYRTLGSPQGGVIWPNLLIMFVFHDNVFVYN